MESSTERGKRQFTMGEKSELEKVPDHLILKILSSHLENDAKTLIQCYLVSKRLAALVSEIETIAVKIEDRHSNSLKGLRKVFPNLRHFNLTYSKTKEEQQELERRRNFYYNRLTKRWKAVIGSRLEICVILQVGSLSEEEEVTKGWNEVVIPLILERRILDLRAMCPHLPTSLRSLTISCPDEKGMIYVGEAQLQDIRANSYLIIASSFSAYPGVPDYFEEPDERLFFIDRLRLSSCKSTATGVAGLIIKRPDRPIQIHRDVLELVFPDAGDNDAINEIARNISKHYEPAVL